MSSFSIWFRLSMLQSAVGVNQTSWTSPRDFPFGLKAGRRIVPDPQARIGSESIPITILGVVNFVKSWNHFMSFAIWPLQAVEVTQTSVFSFKGCRRARIAILECSSFESFAGFDVPVLGMGAILAKRGGLLSGVWASQGSLRSGSAKSSKKNAANRLAINQYGPVDRT